MAIPRDERDRILQLVEAGHITAAEAAELLDALETELDRPREGTGERGERRRNRTLRILATSPGPKRQKTSIVAALPVNLLRISLRLGAQLVPQLDNAAVEDLLRAIDSGATGRLLDLQDLERGERLEIFVE